MGPVNSGFKPKNTHLAGRFNLKKLHIFEKFLTFCKLNIIHQPLSVPLQGTTSNWTSRASFI